MNTRTLYIELTSKLDRVRRKELGIDVQAGLLGSLAALAAIWTVAISLEALFEFGTTGRALLYWGAVGGSAIIAVLRGGIPFARYTGLLPVQDHDTLARRVGHHIPAVGDKLVNTLQLHRASAEASGGYSQELTEASIIAQGEPLRGYDYSVIIEKEDRKRTFLLFLSGAILVTSLFISFPNFYGNAFHRLSNYQLEFIKPAPFTLQIEPGNVKLVHGDSLEITVRALGIPPRSVTLFLQEEGVDTPDDLELREDSAGVFRYIVPGVKAGITYYASSGRVRTPEYQLQVTERPEIRGLQVTVTPPRYTGRSPERLPENNGDVSGLRGTGIGITVQTNIPPQSAQIVQLFPRAAATTTTIADNAAGGAVATTPTPQFDTVRVAMKIEGTTCAGSFAFSRDGQYFVSLRSADSLYNSSPITYTMSVSSDASPTIALVQPLGAAELNETMLLPTQVRIADDYGFSKLRIMYRLSASQYEQPWETYKEEHIEIPQGSPAGLDISYLWNLARSRMVPGDEMEMYVEVFDNDYISGPKSARTGAIAVRFPSFEEVIKNSEEVQQQANADLEKLLKNAEETGRQMEEVNRELMKQLAQKKTEANWQEQKKLQDIIKQHEEMERKLDKIAEDLQAMSEKLQEAKAISPETLQKYQELQKLFDEIKNPELLKSMMEMQQAMENMTPEQMAEAMKNYKFNEEQFRKSIDRTMKILKRMQVQQKVDEMVQRAEKLAQQQDDLNKQMQNTDPQNKAMREQLSERQKQLAEDAKKMSEEANELGKEMDKQGDDMPTQQMQEAQQALQQNSPQGKMQQAQQAMQQGQMQQAQQQGEQAEQAAQDFAQKMKDVQQKMKENEKQQVLNKMKKSLQDMLSLSERQEDLKQQTEGTQPNSQQFRDLAQQQAQMQQDMQSITNQLGQISEKSFSVTPEMGREIGNALQQMGKSTQSLEGRNGYSASGQQGEAMAAMNKSAMMMQQQIAKMQGQGQGQQGMGMGDGMASFQQRLQQLAAQQQMINMAMGQQQGQGEQGSQGQQQQGQGGEGEGNGGKNGKNGEGKLEQLTEQQGQVKKTLEELNKEAREAAGTRKNRVGDLERALKEIEEVLSDMQSGQVTPETMQRQDKILSRLLDAMKSERERDFEKKRESRAGVDITRESPAEIDFGANNARDNAARNAMRLQEQGYSRDYEYMIRKYFESLGQTPAGQ